MNKVLVVVVIMGTIVQLQLYGTKLKDAIPKIINKEEQQRERKRPSSLTIPQKKFTKTSIVCSSPSKKDNDWPPTSI